MTHIVPVASGKGGVGKTLLTASLGHMLAREGKTVLLVDLDLGASNLHSCIGVPNNNPGIGSFIHGKAASLEELIVSTEYPRLYFIPGDQMLPGVANLPFYLKQRIINGLRSLVADYVLLDLGAGSAFNTVDFFLSAPRGIIVTTAEPTSILNAYGFIKTAAYRLLLRSFPRKSEERQRIDEYLSARIEGSQLSFPGLIRELGGISTESGNKAKERLESLYCQVIVNMGRSQEDIALGARLKQVTQSNVGIGLEYIGFVPRDEDCFRSILAKKPMTALKPDSPFAASVKQIARRVLASPDLPAPELLDGDDDLDLMTRLYAQHMAETG